MCGLLTLEELSLRCAKIEKVLLDDAWQLLCQRVTEIEIKEALWSIKDDKSPGPDEFNSFFFKNTWSIVGKEISCAIKEFFCNGEMLKQANSTSIILIPKVSIPKLITNYRPNHAVM